MASTTSEDDSSEDNFSDIYETSRFSIVSDDSDSEATLPEKESVVFPTKSLNLAINIGNRQVYGRFTKHPKSKTERVFDNIHYKCKYPLRLLIRDNKDLFVPGKKLQWISKHKIFRHLKGGSTLEKILFTQFPNDMTKILCCGFGETSNPDLIHITIVTLPSNKSCLHCHGFLSEEFTHRGWCTKHGFLVHYMLATTQPAPKFDPNVSFGFPGHLVLNTGHHIHILNVKTVEPLPLQPATFNLPSHLSSCTVSSREEEVRPNLAMTPFSDRFSEISESASEFCFGTNNSVVDAILEDFSEYDLDGVEGNKPFHELNISCEPLNVTGKSYHNTLVQNIMDPRMKRFQSKDYLFSAPQSSSQAQSNNKVDKNTAVKVYEFTEENEKYEKISLFRKKRLADKKYEFSEDNMENIVPFHILRRERKYLYRPSTSRLRSPEYNALFLSPRSPSWRSPAQSPSSRHGQFSPIGNVRNIYCNIRMSPHHSKSPISPRETTTARKLTVYSPSLDAFSDCSDSDSRLIRTFNSCSSSSNVSVTNDRGCGSNQGGLLIVDPKGEQPKWIRKVVRRYSNGNDLETSSLLSGQSRDDYNIPVEIPLIVEGITDNKEFEGIPDVKADSINERHIIVSQRSIDCEQFVQRRAQILCSEAQMDFLYCEDYDIKIQYVCPLQGTILCSAVIKIGATKHSDKPITKIQSKMTFTSFFLFTWSITTDSFEIVEPSETKKLISSKEKVEFPIIEPPRILGKKVWILGVNQFDIIMNNSKTSLR